MDDNQIALLKEYLADVLHCEVMWPILQDLKKKITVKHFLFPTENQDREYQTLKHEIRKLTRYGHCAELARFRELLWRDPSDSNVNRFISRVGEITRVSVKVGTEYIVDSSNATQAEKFASIYASKAKERAIKIFNKNKQLDAEKGKLGDLQDKLADNLKQMYALNILHPKYQNITAVASIYDYLDTGITRSLVRNDADPGAYYLYEEDVRAQRIVDVITTGFAQLSAQLSQIQRNQYALYTAIQEGNTIMQNIQNELGAISGQINAGNARLTDISNHVVQSASNTDALSSLAREMERNSRILVDINRDKYGVLRNRDGFAI